MIPRSPCFKPIEIDDRCDVEGVTRLHAPYSDFNFASMWCWNLTGATALSLLHGNLVVQMRDYTTEQTVFTFLGDQRLAETTSTLLRVAGEHGQQELRLVPEICLDGDLLAQDCACLPDRDQDDYLYDPATLATLAGPAFRRTRNYCRQFERAHHCRFAVSSLRDTDREEVLDLLAQRVRRAPEARAPRERHDHLALPRAYHPALAGDLLACTLRVEGTLAAVLIGERLPRGWCLAHFIVTDQSLKGGTDYFLHRVALAHHALGDRVLNVEQDLGIPGLRQWKTHWQPSGFLKKYTIVRRALPLAERTADPVRARERPMVLVGSGRWAAREEDS